MYGQFSSMEDTENYREGYLSQDGPVGPVEAVKAAVSHVNLPAFNIQTPFRI